MLLCSELSVTRSFLYAYAFFMMGANFTSLFASLAEVNFINIRQAKVDVHYRLCLKASLWDWSKLGCQFAEDTDYLLLAAGYILIWNENAKVCRIFAYIKTCRCHTKLKKDWRTIYFSFHVSLNKSDEWWQNVFISGTASDIYICFCRWQGEVTEWTRTNSEQRVGVFKSRKQLKTRSWAWRNELTLYLKLRQTYSRLRQTSRFLFFLPRKFHFKSNLAGKIFLEMVLKKTRSFW